MLRELVFGASCRRALEPVLLPVSPSALVGVALLAIAWTAASFTALVLLARPRDPAP